jgi:hypothetical protein
MNDDQIKAATEGVMKARHEKITQSVDDYVPLTKQVREDQQYAKSVYDKRVKGIDRKLDDMRDAALIAEVLE